MAAGLGFKEFITGEVLTAAATNGYMASQTVMVFADSTARGVAITSPQEGMFSYLKDTDALEYYSGAAWVASGASSPLTTKGDVYTFSTVDARLAVGANDTVLTADSTTATGMKWAAPAAGGGMTLLSTTTLSSTSTTISSISQSYKSLFVLIYAINCSANNMVRMRPNASNDVGSTMQVSVGNANATFQTNNTAGILLGTDQVGAGNANNAWSATINNYTSTAAQKPWSIQGNYIQTSSLNVKMMAAGTARDVAAITSLEFSMTGGGTFTGTVLLYGVN